TFVLSLSLYLLFVRLYEFRYACIEPADRVRVSVGVQVYVSLMQTVYASAWLRVLCDVRVFRLCL
ncbi:hypothetical protein IscW_ISCW011154, partial [Ixodes scapularis]